MVWLWDFRKTYNRGQTLQKTKKTRLHVDKEIYKTARYNVENIIAKQKKKKKENKLKIVNMLSTYGKLLNH